MGKVGPKALQCPGWPLCGVVILAVCFLDAQGAALSGQLLSLSSLPKEVLGETHSSVWTGSGGPALRVTYGGLSRWTCTAGLPHTLSQVTLTKHPVKGPGRVIFSVSQMQEW